MTVEMQSYIAAGVSTGIPTPTVITNVVATLRGTQTGVGRPRLRSQRPLRLALRPTSNATCDAPGANDDASGVAAVLEIARVMATRTSSTRRSSSWRWPARSRASTARPASPQQAQQARPGRRRACSPTTSSAARRRQRHRATRTPCGSSPRACRPTRRRRGRHCAARSAARTTRPRASSRATSRRSARTPRPGCTSQIVDRRDRYLRGGDHIPFLAAAAIRRCASPSRTRTSTTSTRTSGSTRTASRSATCPSSSTSTTSRAWRGQRARRSPPRVAPDARPRTSASTRRNLTYDTDPALEGQPRARPRGLRGRVARIDRSAVDAHDPGGRRHELHDPRPVEGQRPGRRARRGPDGYRSPVAFPIPQS